MSESFSVGLEESFLSLPLPLPWRVSAFFPLPISWWLLKLPEEQDGLGSLLAVQTLGQFVQG